MKNDTRQRRLRESVAWSWEKLKTFRDKRREAIRNFVGMHYSAAGSKDKMPVHFLATAVQIYLHQLAARCPKTAVTTAYRHLKPTAAELALLMDYTFKRIGFGATLRGLVTDAIFSAGICKTGVSEIDAGDAGDVRREPGEVFADRVSLDDWIIDVSAQDVPRAAYMGDRYSLPYEPLMESGRVPKDLRDRVKPDRGQPGDRVDARANHVSSGRPEPDKQLRQMVSLQDLWVPHAGREGLVVTMVGGVPIEAVTLWEKEWEGVEEGPYRQLGFQDVPDNVMPLAPVALWRDMDDLANRMWNKIARQAERQKTIAIAQRRAAKDAERVRDASDGTIVTTDGPPKNALMEFRYGGPDQASLGAFLQAKNLFAWLAGNLDTLGGLSPMADTLGQEELLQAGASKIVEDMRRREVEFLEAVCRDVAWYQWKNPLLDARLVKSVQGTSIQLPVRFTPETRRGEFIDYHLKILPYSTQYVPPGSRLRQIKGYLQDIVVPLKPMFDEQGATLRLDRLTELVAEYGQVEELRDVVEFTGVPAAAAAGSRGPAAARPPVTRHESVRRNVPGATRRGQDDTLARIMAGAGVQSAEAGAMTRPVG